MGGRFIYLFILASLCLILSVEFKICCEAKPFIEIYLVYFTLNKTNLRIFSSTRDILNSSSLVN